MLQDFIATLTQTEGAIAHPAAKVRMILLGTPEDVNSVIYDLYQRGFAEVTAWSPPQPIPDSQEVIRLLIRRFGRSASPHQG
ncbi:MAG: hypothetical protein KME15_09185 [Drouetiella hepatica Uher 2000/2452]|jgi:alkanesulfonate monooxygenase SsuD/methylene tetrahydromethanopterin reductase-like flavin-dependent oxidoreductase (luciferase family)|uniref:Uncharacterized protein n=1 Tax=Drouetiella hepatica Uher 2000/2452 TaxID=904376 RepID=A0A951UM45_9CYAN|nr:hypothetical protein [Drouetiella hepatica Uher 2000/2452]